MSLVYAFVPIATLIYLLVDLYPSVKSFSAIVWTPSFLLLFALYTILNLIAFAALNFTAGPKINEMLHNQPVTTLTVVILSTLSTLTILQSLSLKIADYKFIDVGQLVENYRKRVLEDIASYVTTRTRSKQRELMDKLFYKFKSDITTLRNEYVDVMDFGGRSTAEIGQELNEIEQQARANNLLFERQIIRRIVKVDPARAKQLLKQR